MARKKTNRDGIVKPELLPSGSWRYRIRDKREGRYVWSTFQRTAEDTDRTRPGTAAGDRWAKATQAKLELGLATARVTTLGELGASYLEQQRNSEISESQLGIIENTLRFASGCGIDDLADRRLCAVIQGKLSALQAVRHGQRTPTPASQRTKNKHIAVLRAIGRFGVSSRALIFSPFDGLKKFPEHVRARPIYFVEELRALLRPANLEADPWGMAVALAIYTGQRSATIRGLTWDMIDWKAQKIRIPAAILKQRADLAIPLQAELGQLLEPHAQVGRSTILTPDLAKVTSDRANELTQRYLRRCGVDHHHRSMHTFRHTAAALLTATGLSHWLVMDRIGHSSTATSKHYSKMAEDLVPVVKAEGWPAGEFRLSGVSGCIKAESQAQ